MTADFDASQRAEQARAGVPAGQQGRGVAAQVALARRESPHRGQQHLGLARVLTLERCRTRWPGSPRRAGQRMADDADGAGDRVPRSRGSAAGRRGTRRRSGCVRRPWWLGVTVEVVVACQRLAARVDPGAVVARRRRAESERRVSLRPAPDTMSQLSALLPVAQGVAVYAALARSADTARAG